MADIVKIRIPGDDREWEKAFAKDQQTREELEWRRIGHLFAQGFMRAIAEVVTDLYEREEE